MKFVHIRPSKGTDHPELVAASNLFGITIASADIATNDYHSGKELVGWSMCLGDPFSRRAGRDRALARLLQNALFYGRGVNTVHVPHSEVERGHLNKAFWKAVGQRVGDDTLSFRSNFDEKAAALLILSRQTV